MIQRYRYISFELLQTCCVVCDGSVRCCPIFRCPYKTSPTFNRDWKQSIRVLLRAYAPNAKRTGPQTTHKIRVDDKKSFISRNLSPTSHRKRRRTRSIFSFNPSYTLVSAASTILHQKKSQQQPVHHAS